MSTTANILQASIGGSVELLTVSGAGALLAHLGYFQPEVSSSLSKGLYRLFIPCLVFGSVLDTVSNAVKSAGASTGEPSAMQELWVPVALALSIFVITAVVAFPLTRIIGRNKEEAVRRAIFVCLILGNANTMPLLVMQSLCSEFSPLQFDGKCYTQAMGYASLFMTVVNIVAWTALFQYMLFAPDSSVTPSAEAQSLMESGQTTYSNIAGPATVPIADNRLRDAISHAILSPPFLTVIAATGLAFIPRIPEAFLSDTGALQPLLLSINTIGQVVVPVSCMIVGAELYRSFAHKSDNLEKNDEMRPEEKFGLQAVISIVSVRMVLLPFVGRSLYTLLNLSGFIANPRLGIFILSQFNVPTANNTVIMVSIAAESLPRIGKQLREDVSRAVFYQFLATPIFLTLNTAAALSLQFPSS